MNITNRISPNRTAGRGARIDRLVWHHTGGAFGPSLNWILNPASQVSYHYMIDRHGNITRTVHEGDTAWHAGTWAMNARSIGICGETGGWTVQARNAFAALTRDICGRRGLPINRTTIIGHRQVVQTACPGDLPIDAWVAFAASGAVEVDDMFSERDRSTLNFIWQRLDNTTQPGQGQTWEDTSLARISGRLAWIAERLDNVTSPAGGQGWDQVSLAGIRAELDQIRQQLGSR